jgi:hypothetical protein
MTANLGKPMRILYVIVGVAVVVTPLAMDMNLWMKIALPALGLLAIITGATGW